VVGTNADRFLMRRRKMQSYQGKPIRSSRPAKQGDEGFKQQGQGQQGGDDEQVCITLQDGTEKVVSKKEVTTSNE